MTTGATSSNRLHITTVDSPSALHAFVTDRLAAQNPTLEQRATLLTDTGELAHQLRRHVAVERVRPGLLYGLRVMRPAGLAAEILARSGLAARSYGNELRRLHLLSLLENDAIGDKLEYFKGEALTLPGYVDAFARTINDLERAGLTTRRLGAIVERLDAAGERVADVLAVWREIELEAGTGDLALTPAGLLLAASRELEHRAELLRPFGRILCLLARDPSVALIHFLEALPRIEVGLLDARPRREHTRRFEDLVGGLHRWEPQPVDSSGEAASALASLRQRLFLTGRHSTGGASDEGELDHASVVIEEYASVDEEVEATAGWVLEQITRGIALEDIAIVATDIDTYATLIADRLGRVTTTDGAPLPVRVLDGCAAARTPAGARILALLRAFREGLPAAETTPLLSVLRPAASGSTPNARPLSPSRAQELIGRAGITGGSRAHPDGALQWVRKLEALIASFEREIEETREQPMPPAPGAHRQAQLDLLPPDPSAQQPRLPLFGQDADASSEEPKDRDRHRHAERWLRLARSVLPAVTALEDTARRLQSRMPLSQLWPALREWIESWLILPAGGDEILAALDAAVSPLIRAPIADRVNGMTAVAFLVHRLEALRVLEPHGTEAAITIGSATAARGLGFDAVRLVGLAEGVAPGVPRDDPVLPDELRRRIETVSPGLILERVEDDVVADLHALYRVMTGARRQLTLSSPRQWIDGSDRERSGVVLEVSMAISGKPASGVAGARHRRAWTEHMPVLPGALLSIVATRHGGRAVPESWLAGDNAALDLGALCRLDASRLEPQSFGALDGDLAAVWSVSVAPGLSADHPLSATKLQTLLRCPHRFLLSHVLQFPDPPEPLERDRINRKEYGALVHRVMERFLSEVGAAYSRREAPLEQWITRARQVAEEEFARVVGTLPLASPEITKRERRQLMRHVERLIRHDWEQPQRRFVAAELRFGEPEPVALAGLHLRGRIDRVDRLADGALGVRDYKTGQPHSLLSEALNLHLDLQIALYARVVASAEELDVGGGVRRVGEAAYVHPALSRDPERRFEGATLAELDAALDVWLREAHRLLASGVFPRTIDEKDCRYCPFRPHCGKEAQKISAAKLTSPDVPAAASAYATFREADRHA